MTAAIEDYTSLITSEHRKRPRFLAMVKAVTGFAVDARNLLATMPQKFDVDGAEGEQLDYLGYWVGVTRTITIEPSDAFPDPSEPYQATLDDATFRRLVRARALANAWDGSAQQASEILTSFYAPAGAFAVIRDNQDMSIDLFITGVRVTPAEAAILSQFILPLRAAGVLLNSTQITTSTGPLFGLDYQNDVIAGPDYGTFGETF